MFQELNNSSTDMTLPESPHVAVLAFPFSTHAAPLLTITRHLSCLAPETYFSFFSTSKSLSSILAHGNDHLAETNLRCYAVSDGVPEGYEFSGKHQEDIELFMKVAPESFRRGMVEAEVERGRKVTCLLTDAFFWFAAEMATERRVKWAAFWTAGPVSLSTHVHTDLIRDTIGLEAGAKGNDLDRSLNFIPGLSLYHVRDLQEGILVGNLNSVFSNMLHKMGLMLDKADLVFANSFDALDLEVTRNLKSKFRKFLNIGPFNLMFPPASEADDDKYGCLPWLNDQNDSSVAYISFGSVTTPPPHELAAIAEGLEESGVKYVWSIKDSPKEHLPKGFVERTRENGKFVPWAPQRDILGHKAVGTFVTHCGWNSLLESVIGGVPMICRPFFGDQRLNARMIEDVLKIGLKIDNGVFTKDGMVKALDQVLFQKQGMRMRERIKDLKEVALESVGPKGSSSQNLKTLLDVVSSI